jgi:hypothetical protein
MRETQHAELTIRVAKSFDQDFTEDERKDVIAKLVGRALTEGDHFENRGVFDTELTVIETPDEAAERRMAEAESEALAKAERRAERFQEERAGRHLW